MARERSSREQVVRLFQECNNWGRWGPEDQLGTINYITPEKRKLAASLVKEGVSLSCSRPIVRERAPDVYEPVLHYMISSGERWAGVKSEPGQDQGAVDFIGLAFHGYTITHLDALGHIFWDGKMYNGFPAEAVTTREGATKESVDLLANGILTRGVLLDIPRLRGVKWLEPGEPIFPEELTAAEEGCGVRVESGDALFVRTGALRRRNELGPSPPLPRAGLEAACVPWVHQRQVALLGSGQTNDVSVPEGSQAPSAFHHVGIVGMGLWLIDAANLEELAAACEERGRWEFMLSISPLRIVYGTGSPVNPIATF